MNKVKEVVTRGEIKFWASLFVIAMTGVLAFANLKKDVEAMVRREQMNKEQFHEIASTVKATNETVIELRTRQEYILKFFKINGY